ncbi:hypothetical protein EDF56_11511 [Novosphingobium sp. PhB165]|uniref:hypothetical protein n=1 Tax=Novosphingobium sp. PhB165 TaxID=2485105 RepID=UPI00104FC42E|nr:hypothetical protein [Novosphingobium sp. PhB165]TCM13986.1 hypothetical protein EDF56_11511 [Novosphingobium sp. PhB165]
MTVYTLKFAKDRHGPAKDIQFEGGDPGAALQFAETEPPDRRAELWEGSRKLCVIRRTGDDVWQVGTSLNARKSTEGFPPKQIS